MTSTTRKRMFMWLFIGIVSVAAALVGSVTVALARAVYFAVIKPD